MMLRLLKVSLGLGLALALLQASLYAQSGTSGLGGVSSTYNLGNSTFGSVQYTITISIEYGQNLTASQYISQSQLTADYTGFVSSYPNAQDPPEAILLSVANSFAKKYSQFQLVSVGAIAGSTSSFQAEIVASAGNLQIPGVPTGMTSLSDAMRRSLARPAPSQGQTR